MTSRPEPHFVLVTYGLSAPHVGEEGEEAPAGFGIELTLRVARAPSERENIPPWARWLLERLAAYVGGASAFEAGEHFDLTAPLTEGSLLEAILFAADAALPSPVEGPGGGVALLQCVALTRDEYTALRAWRGAELTELLTTRQPLFVAHPKRSSLMADREFRSRCEEGSARDGSSFVVAFGRVTWSVEPRFFGRLHAVVEIGRHEAREVGLGLRLQVACGQPFVVIGGEPDVQSLVFAPAEADDCRWFVDERDAASSSLAILVAPSFVGQLQAAFASAEVGTLEWAAIQGLVVNVVADA